jgi:hypothetical protein
MNTDRMQRATRSVLGGLVAVGLTLGLTAGATAQEDQHHAKKGHQEAVKEALSNADQHLAKIAQQKNIEAGDVEVMKAGEVFTDGTTASELRGSHAAGVQKFQKALRDHGAVKTALENHGAGVGDVLAAHLATPASGGGEKGGEASGQPTLHVVVATTPESGPGTEGEDSGSGS